MMVTTTRNKLIKTTRKGFFFFLFLYKKISYLCTLSVEVFLIPNGLYVDSG